ncbi:hypothetical protein [Acidovorax sp.]|uniref:hypothetical protein n=1 Tax=Acidovorax sp. TaxID=1872122 RepID=UPI00391F0AF8
MEFSMRPFDATQALGKSQRAAVNTLACVTNERRSPAADAQHIAAVFPPKLRAMNVSSLLRLQWSQSTWRWQNGLIQSAPINETSAVPWSQGLARKRTSGFFGPASSPALPK